MFNYAKFTLLTLAAFLVLGFSITANAKASQVEVVNTPDVNVTNIPDVNVVNRPNVTVTNTPNVRVVNTTPLNVVVTNAPLKIDFHQERHAEIGSLWNIKIPFDNIPTGKLLEVEHISVLVYLQPDSEFRCSVYVWDGVNPSTIEVSHNLNDISQAATISHSTRHTVSMPITYYVPSHLYHELGCNWLTQEADPHVITSISGYYIDE